MNTRDRMIRASCCNTVSKLVEKKVSTFRIEKINNKLQRVSHNTCRLPYYLYGNTFYERTPHIIPRACFMMNLQAYSYVIKLLIMNNKN